MPTEPARFVDAMTHRKLGVDLFNHTWTLIEKEDRGPEDEAEMVHAAHASRWHWARAEGCEPKNLAIGEWQISHVYAITERAEPAAYHARRNLRLCEEHGLTDYLLAYAYEALARAAAVAGKDAERERWLQKGWEAAEGIADAGTREKLEADLGSIRAL